MREIKFRAWDAVTLAMYKVSTLINNGRVGVVIAGCAPFYKDNTIIMQYTGLKDKNDKGIYEGDIVEIEIRDEDSCMGSTFIEKYVVEWDNKKHRFCYSDNKYHVMGSFNGKWGLDYPNEMAEEINIIGNIYENPELLESDK